MFFVGASAHPGTGVPVVICGSKLTADHVDAYLTGKSIVDSAKYEGAAMLFALFALIVFIVVQLTLGRAGLANVTHVLYQNVSWDHKAIQLSGIFTGLKNEF
jgi:phytoene desaturase (3,4-didehydrolycopene-forming)